MLVVFGEYRGTVSSAVVRLCRGLDGWVNIEADRRAPHTREGP